MPRQISTLLALIALLIVCAASLTGTARAVEYDFKVSDKDLKACHVRVNGSWDVRIKLLSLLGEPVVSTRFRYRFSPGQTIVSLPALDGSRSYFETSLKDIPSDVRTLARLYDIKIRFRFKTGLVHRPYVHLVSDVGNPGKPDGKTWSFNVPGSPDWAKFLTSEPGGSYLSAADAKKAFASGLALSGAEIVSCKLTEFDLQTWYAKHSKWPEVRATEMAYNYLADAIERSTGLKPPRYRPLHVNSTVHTVRDNILEGQTAWLKKYRERLKKLQMLPEPFIPDDNPRPLKTALEEAPRIVQKARDHASQWVSPDTDPSGLLKGYPPKGAPAGTELASADDTANSKPKAKRTLPRMKDRTKAGSRKTERYFRRTRDRNSTRSSSGSGWKSYYVVYYGADDSVDPGELYPSNYQTKNAKRRRVGKYLLYQIRRFKRNGFARSCYTTSSGVVVDEYRVRRSQFNNHYNRLKRKEDNGNPINGDVVFLGESSAKKKARAVANNMTRSANRKGWSVMNVEYKPDLPPRCR